jgi:hypothetical protein
MTSSSGKAAKPAATEPVEEQLVSTPMPADFTRAIEEEYGELRAAHLLLVGGVPAFGEGSPVNRSHPMVPQWLEDGSVVRVKQA